MPASNPNPQTTCELVVETLVTAAHQIDDYWPTVETVDHVRRITRLTANLLNALVDGNPVAASKALRCIDDIHAQLPGEG